MKRVDKCGEICFQAGRASLVLAHALWTHAQDLGFSQAKLPNGPVNHMQRHKEAYAGLCQFMLRNYRVSRPQLQWVSDRLVWHQRSWLGLEDEWTPQNLH